MLKQVWQNKLPKLTYKIDMLPINQIKAGMTFIYNGEIHLMLENKSFKIGRGRPVIKCKIRNILKNVIQVVNITERSRFEQVVIVKKQVQFLYISNQQAYFADQEKFEMFEMSTTLIDNQLKYLTDGAIVELRFYNEKPILLVLPVKVKLTVNDTDENVNTTSNITRSIKKAELNTGYKLDVPSFIKKNEEIYVSTVTGKYVSRAEKP